MEAKHLSKFQQTAAGRMESTNRSHKHTALSAGPKEFVDSYSMWLTENFVSFLSLFYPSFTFLAPNQYFTFSCTQQ